MAVHESRALLPTITVRAFVRCRTTMPSADFCCEIKAPFDALSHDSATHKQISRGKFYRLPHATAGFTTSALDGYGLHGQLPARPAPYASDPVLVHRLVRLLHASFRPSVAGTPLRFATTSPPSGCRGDFHPRAVEHARHTTEAAPEGGCRLIARPTSRRIPLRVDSRRQKSSVDEDALAGEEAGGVGG